MELNEIFTKKNIEILKLMFKESLHIRDIAKKLNISPAKVHNSIKVFKKNNLIKETKQKNRIIISLNTNNPILSQINEFILNFLLANNILLILYKIIMEKICLKSEISKI